MRPAHPTERTVGIEHYVSDADGVGGRLRERDEHFRVVELERFATEPVDADPADYPHLVVRATLRGWDTNDFAARVSDALGISRERVSWAGTKDKHAVTTQLFSIYDAAPDDLPDPDGVDLEVVGRAGRSLEFGDLSGNAFELVVSEPERPEAADAITAELRTFAGLGDERGAPSGRANEEGTPEVGVPNFFGQQRFGSRRPVTHEVGLEIVRGDWEGAVMAYVGNPFDAEPDGTRAAREFVEETRDWTEALERFPNRLRYERSMLHELAELEGEPGPDDFRAALERLPSNLQRLFVHAAQSYAFNRILSERLERGLPFAEPVAGDVVCFVDEDASVSPADRAGAAERADGIAALESDVAVPDTDGLQRVDDRRLRSVRRHCERGRAFVTAPLVGTETEFGDGEPGEIERAVFDELGLEPADFDLPGEFHSRGTRRAILVRTAISLERDPLTLSFALPKGSYATVVTREYLKTDPMAMD